MYVILSLRVVSIDLSDVGSPTTFVFDFVFSLVVVTLFFCVGCICTCLKPLAFRLVLSTSLFLSFAGI